MLETDLIGKIKSHDNSSNRNNSKTHVCRNKPSLALKDENW